MTYHGPNPDRSQRRVTREQLEASRRAWDAGRFGPEWREWRHLAAMQAGIIDPPAGDAYDSWADSEPSERAILVRAIRETPRALRAALTSGKVHTWSQVVRLILQHRDRLGDDANQRSHEWDVTRRAPMVPLADTLGVVADSLGMDR